VSGRLRDQLVQDLGQRLHLVDQADTLAGHQRAVLDVAIDHRPAQRPGPEMLDRERGFLEAQRAGAMSGDELELGRDEAPARPVGERAHRDHLELRVDLDRGHGIARARPDECLLEDGMGDRLARADEARAHLTAGRTHAQIGRDRLAVADAAGDEDRHLAQMRQDLLGEHAGRDRPDVTARFHALDHQSVRALTHQLPGDAEAGREA
jgi:hypothetical protein